jgi:hypothetical protein
MGFIAACGNEDSDDGPKAFVVTKFAPVSVQKTNKTAVYAHYMPWFETPETTGNGKWGMHWTMNTQNPETMDENGKRNIASHFYPLTGPYASSDLSIIEYHLLLMKYSGIDGILIDWYGSFDVNDYGSNRKNSEALIDALDEVGLKFAVVYEDRTVPLVVEKGGAANRVEAAQADMVYLEQNYFGKPNYIQIDGKPLLMVFGPEEFHQQAEWGEIFSVFNQAPTFVTLNGTSQQTQPHSSGEYVWVDQGSLDPKYATKSKFTVFIGGAYPSFADFYKQGGWGTGFDWSIDPKNGETFKLNLQKAKTAGVDYLQLITWNDYGEGTMIEPTEEFGFTMLEHVQAFTGVNYTKTELEKIFDLYQLRKSKTTADAKKQLDQVFYYLVSLQSEKAIHIIDSLQLN